MSYIKKQDLHSQTAQIQAIRKDQTKQNYQENKNNSNTVKQKYPINEVCHLGVLNSNMPQRIGLLTQPVSQYVMPHKAPHNTLIPEKCSIRPPSLPPTERGKSPFSATQQINIPQATNISLSHCGEQQKKQGLSIKVQETSPSGAGPNKSMSTRHASAERTNKEIAKVPALQSASSIVIPNDEPAKCSIKKNGLVRAYAANTNQGLVRYYQTCIKF